MTRIIKYTEAINEALHEAMARDESVLLFGLGVDDPKRIFATTAQLVERFGSERVFDMPTAENAMTGIGIGASLLGFRPVMVHQRLDFFLLAMDQLVNNAAKWYFMFGGQKSVPITIRLVTGRGWGQGPTHSQNLHAWFAHIPGLKVVMPAFPADAKGMLLSAIFDDNPVIVIEHRWVHALEGEVVNGDWRIPLGKGRVVTSGDALTIVALSYMTIEALHAVEQLKQDGIYCELIDLRSIQPLDWELIFTSVKKTGRLLALDIAATSFSVASELVARCAIELFADLKCPPRKLALPDCPVPTSFGLTKGFYITAVDIVETVGAMLNCPVPGAERLRAAQTTPHDVPGEWFKGPF